MKIKTYKIVTDDQGLPMRVMRPSDPEMCMAIAKECLDRNDTARLDRLPEEAMEKGVTYDPVGFLGRRPGGKTALVDREGHVCGKIQPGDSFVTFSADGN